MLTYMWIFGDYIERIMLAKGLNVNRLAKLAGLSHVYVGDLIKGESRGKQPRPTIDTILALSKALNIDYNNLILAYRGFDPDKVEPKDIDKASDLVNDILRLIDKHQGGSL